MAKKRSAHAQEKRRREIAKQKKRKEKRERKLERRDDKPDDAENPSVPDSGEAAPSTGEVHEEPRDTDGNEPVS